MPRLTITVDNEFAAELDRFMAARGYTNRSEAIRDLSRSGLRQAATEVANARDCVAVLLYVYDHETRELSRRLTRGYHDHHNLGQATLHVHLDHESCLELTVLKGRGKDVQKLADHVIAERGVRHGQVAYLLADGAHLHNQKNIQSHRRGPRRGHSHAEPNLRGQIAASRPNRGHSQTDVRR